MSVAGNSMQVSNVFLMWNEVCKLNALLSDPAPLYLSSCQQQCRLVCAVRSRVDGDIIEKVGNKHAPTPLPDVRSSVTQTSTPEFSSENFSTVRKSVCDGAKKNRYSWDNS